MNDFEQKRIAGCFYGQVIGDALGASFEFQSAAKVQRRMSELRHHNPSRPLAILGCKSRNIERGQFTDDTEMALSLARSIVALQSFNKSDVAVAYCFWLRVTKPKTSGKATRAAFKVDIISIIGRRLSTNFRNELSVIEKQKIADVIANNVKEHNTKSLSNGSLMRVSPLAIAFRHATTGTLRSLAKADASITHTHPIIGDAAATYCVAIAALIKGKSKEEAFSAAYDSAETEFIRELMNDAKTHDIPVKLYPSSEGKTTEGDDEYLGYFGIAFQAAFYHLLHARSFASGLEAAISRGGDTDTNGCIVAALLGARFGIDAVPSEWIDPVKNAGPCLLSHRDVRKRLDMSSLSIQDADKLIHQLSNIKI